MLVQTTATPGGPRSPTRAPTAPAASRTPTPSISESLLMSDRHSAAAHAACCLRFCFCFALCHRCTPTTWREHPAMAISDQFVAIAACSFMGYTYDPCMVRLSPAQTAVHEVLGVCGVSQSQSLSMMCGRATCAVSRYLGLQPADADTAAACSGSSHPGRQPA